MKFLDVVLHEPPDGIGPSLGELEPVVDVAVASFSDAADVITSLYQLVRLIELIRPGDRLVCAIRVDCLSSP